MAIELNPEWFQVRWRDWYLTIYFDPRVWAFDFHRKAPCCKWWLLVGPFELNRIWADGDVYPFEHEDLD